MAPREAEKPTVVLFGYDCEYCHLLYDDALAQMYSCNYGIYDTV